MHSSYGLKQAMDKDLEMRIIEAIPLTMDLNPMYYDSKANILFLLLCLFLHGGNQELIVALYQFTLLWFKLLHTRMIKWNMNESGISSRVLVYKRLKYHAQSWTWKLGEKPRWFVLSYYIKRISGWGWDSRCTQWEPNSIRDRCLLLIKNSLRRGTMPSWFLDECNEGSSDNLSF